MYRSGAACFTFSSSLDGASGIAGQIQDQAGVGMPLQILQHANIEVRRDLLDTRRRAFALGMFEQVIANHLAKMFVGGSHQKRDRHTISYGRHVL